MLTCSELSCELLKLVIAALMGGIVGFERETHGQAAGLRTNVLVCTGACLLMMLSLYIPVLYREVPMTDSVIRLDPARIASYAIASMGFLGAGAIISGKGTVKGLTTAASIWLVTGIGLAVGAGYFLPALTCVGLSLLVLYGFRKIKKYLPRDEHTLLTLVFDQDQKHLEAVQDYLQAHRCTINFINYYLDHSRQTLTYKLRLQSKMNIPWGQLINHLQQLEGLQQISWEEAAVP
jgi:putative Mg2+ transporter-C (MgtC) family protein